MRLCLMVVFLVGCSSSGGRPPPRTAEPAPQRESNPLFVPPGSYDFTANPRLLERVRSSAHGYFRFVNIAFSDCVCRRYADALPSIPRVNLHGDAHIEQYAVTSIGRGLTDFDDASAGPGIIDLLRQGVSLRLTATAKGWQDRAPELFDHFLRGYLAALDDPTTTAPEPAVVARMRSRFHEDRAAYLSWTDSLMEPLDDSTRRTFVEDAQPYVRAMLDSHTDLPPTFFRLKNMGRLKMGIGSALDEKYLVRVEGPTPAAEDDVILEAKEVPSLEGISCVDAAGDDPFRILVGQSRIAYQPYPYLGYVRIGGRIFWIHGWVDNYRELSPDDLESVEELAEVAFDAGVQLGRGQVAQIAAPLDLQLRRAQKEMVEDLRPRLERDCVALAELTATAWRRFSAVTAAPGPAVVQSPAQTH